MKEKDKELTNLGKPRRYTEIQKRQMISDWAKSGLSQKEYCILHKINYRSFQYWNKYYRPIVRQKDLLRWLLVMKDYVNEAIELASIGQGLTYAPPPPRIIRVPIKPEDVPQGGARGRRPKYRNVLVDPLAPDVKAPISEPKPVEEPSRANPPTPKPKLPIPPSE